MASPLPFVVRSVGSLRPGRALDVACGRGRHLAWLAGLGWSVVGVDRDDENLREAATRAPQARLVRRDLEAAGLPADWSGAFGLVVMTYFLHRPLFADVARVLAPGGHFVLETFHEENRRRRGHPRRAWLALSAGEGRVLCEAAGLAVVVHEEGEGESAEVAAAPAVTTRVVAVKPPLTTGEAPRGGGRGPPPSAGP